MPTKGEWTPRVSGARGNFREGRKRLLERLVPGGGRAKGFWAAWRFAAKGPGTGRVRLSVALAACAVVAGLSRSGAVGSAVASARGPGVAKPVADRQCLGCHGEEGFGQKEAGRDLFVDKQRLADSAHGRLRCVECHAALTFVPHQPFVAREVDCRRCHTEATSKMRLGVHGIALAKGDASLPACVDCHGGHEIELLSREKRLIFKERLVAVCVGCHTSEAIAARLNLPRSDVILGFKNSTHRRRARADEGKLPLCADCHGAHGAGLADGGQSKASRAAGCGSCHGTQEAQWQGSVHAAGAGTDDASACGCLDCHTEHRLRLWATDPKAAAKSSRSCGACHEPRPIKGKLALKAGGDSAGGAYHGIFVRFGTTYAAACESCHGYHDVRPASHPFSRVNVKNLVRECARCHEVGEAEMKGRSLHGVSPRKPEKPRWVGAIDSPWIWPAAVVFFTILGFVAVFLYALIGKAGRRPEMELPQGRGLK